MSNFISGIDPKYRVGDNQITLFTQRVHVTARFKQTGYPGNRNWSGWVYDLVVVEDDGFDSIGVKLWSVPECLIEDMDDYDSTYADRPRASQ